MIRLFVGYDERESAVFHAFNQSVLDNTSVPVAITPLHGPMLDNFDGQQDGTNRFIYSRYLVPLLCDYEGWAIFMDGDMIVRGDLKELWEMRDDKYAAMVVQHNYRTRCKRKYVGTPLENDNVDYPRKNWSSVVLWNCGHPDNKKLTKEHVATAGPVHLHRFKHLKSSLIGKLPGEWNYLVDEFEPGLPPKLIHYTLGAPGIKGYEHCGFASDWHETMIRVVHMSGQDPVEMMERADGRRRSTNGSRTREDDSWKNW